MRSAGRPGAERLAISCLTVSTAAGSWLANDRLRRYERMAVSSGAMALSEIGYGGNVSEAVTAALHKATARAGLSSISRSQATVAALKASRASRVLGSS